MRAQLALLTLAILASGCGTMANLEGKELPMISAPGQRESRFYGGVQNNIRWTDLSNTEPQHIPVRLLGCSFFIADCATSLIADTLTLPIVWHQRRHRSFSPLYNRPFPSAD